MICNFPSPTSLSSLGQARIVVPSLVMEFIGTIRQSAPHKRGDRVDHHPEFVFGTLHFELCWVWNCFRGVANLRHEPRALFGDGFPSAYGSPVGTRFSPRVDAGFNLFEDSAKPNQRNMTYALLVKRISQLAVQNTLPTPRKAAQHLALAPPRLPSAVSSYQF